MRSQLNARTLAGQRVIEARTQLTERIDGRQKREELALFEQFVRLMRGVPDGVASQPAPPEPDIVVRAQNVSLGVEITQPRPFADIQRQSEGEQDGIVSAAAKLYEKSGGLPVHVLVHWSSASVVVKTERASLAATLAALVHLRRPGQNTSVEIEPTGEPGDPLPRHIDLLQISRSEIYEQSAWYSPRGAMVAALSRDEIEERLRVKEGKLATYLGIYQQIWLLLAVETGGPSTWRVIPDWLLVQRFETNFDRVLIMEIRHNRVSELRVHKPERIDHLAAG